MCGILFVLNYGESIELNKYNEMLNTLTNRGPDMSKHIYQKTSSYEYFMGFTRLSIMDLSNTACQPFVKGSVVSVTNGEIYNYKKLIDGYNLKCKTNCDCEVVNLLYERYGLVNTIDELDAEFATILLDDDKLYACRDKYGVRPLFYGWNDELKIIGIASEAKTLHSLFKVIKPLNPQTLLSYNISQGYKKPEPTSFIVEKVYNNMYYGESEKIKELLINAVEKRMDSDRPLGFLLSGGLDSSLILAIASKIMNVDDIYCFTIGLPNSSDVLAAKKVVEYLNIKNHIIVDFNVEDGIKTIKEVIKTIETYDITTIRASTPQYLLAKEINKMNHIKVLLSGEGSDELHGSYRYFKNAPSEKEFDDERKRLLDDLYMYDNLRTDRTMAGNGLEVRVPFLDYEYTNYILKSEAKLFMSGDCIEKKILRDSFKGYLPDEILYRSKEAFSDAVSSNEVNWYKSIEKYANEIISDEEMSKASEKYKHNPPECKEALLYRNIFNEIYPERDELIQYYWLPKFQNKKITDPSATVLDCY